jgi:anti-sigma B factor antagonist
MNVRQAPDGTAIVDIKGDVTSACEPVLMSAYESAGGGEAKRVVLNFSNLDYMNSGGIGMLVTLLVRAKRQHQQLAAFGLSEHYRQIFALTRLDEVIGIHATAADALTAAGQ